MSIEAIPSMLSGVVAMALGSFVWSRASRPLANRAFAWGMAALAVMELAHVMLLRAWPPEFGVWPRVAFGAEALAQPGWALFSVAFARADAASEVRRWRWALAGIGGLALAALATAALRPLHLPPGSLETDFLQLSDYGKALAIFALLASVFVLFQLESTLRNSRGIARWQIKYFILGVAGIFAFRIFVLSQMLLTDTVRLAYLPVQATASVVAFALIGFCLVRHRLLEVDVFVSRHAVYRSLAVATVGAYLVVIGIGGWLTQHLHVALNLFLTSLVVFVTAMALLIGLLSEALRDRVKRAIARHFYRNKYDYRREWTEFTRKLTSVLSPDTIAPRIVEMVAEAMGTRKAALFLSENGGQHRLADEAGGIASEPLSIDRTSPLIVRAAAEGRPLVLAEVDPDDPLAGAVAPLRAQGLTLLVPLVAKGEVLGLLAVGLAAGSPTPEDDELLTTVAAQAATALLNARLSEQLAQARELEALSRVSSFMLHDLKNCVSMLSLVAQNAETVGGDAAFQRDAFRTVGESVTKMRELIDRLSHLPKEMELKLASLDLNGLAKEALERVRLAVDGTIRLSIELDEFPPIAADADQVRKILDNLLINAVEALPSGGEVRVRTRATKGAVSLEVTDTGPGIPESILRAGLFTPFQTTKAHGLGIGLYQVKSIVQAHGGQIRVASQAGTGTTIEVEFPAPAGGSNTHRHAFPGESP